MAQVRGARRGKLRFTESFWLRNMVVLIQPDSLRRIAAVPIKRRAEAIFEVWDLPTMYLRLCLLSGAGQGRYVLKRRRCS
jgi:hypothetical protein